MSSPPAVPYQAYKPKRHSQTLSTHLTPNQSPPPISRPSTAVDAQLHPPRLSLEREQPAAFSQPPIKESPDPVSSTPTLLRSTSELPSPLSSSSGSLQQQQQQPEALLAKQSTTHSPKPSHIPASSSAGQSSAQPVTKKSSTFRRLQPKNARPRQLVERSRPESTPFPTSSVPEHGSNIESKLAVPSPVHLTIEVSPAQTPPEPSTSNSTPPPQVAQRSLSHKSQQSTSSVAHVSSRNDSPILRTTSTSTTSEIDPFISDNSTHSSPLPSRKAAPYRPGFQPKGIYRPLTDEFFAIRQTLPEGEGESGMRRVERTKLERRLEKLIALHFPRPSSVDRSKEHLDTEIQPSITVTRREKRRASSFFDFQTLRNLNINDAGDLWRGVVSGSLGDPLKNDIRAAEQRITPWQDDATVSKCPLCLALFHTLTNRKHHCRLCGQIICSLPIKYPQRKSLCSTLFVVDVETRQIEEVGEGVDYGVKRRRKDSFSGHQERQEEEEKFLKGVRICRECRPILLKQQYQHQPRSIPPYAKLHEQFILLESDIEESLPKFQELLMSLNHHDQPTKEASAARKRLLDSFAQYDKLSKAIRQLPCPNGPGSSQDRVQSAILTRANLFLQKNMFPLQSLPTPQHSSKLSGTSKSPNGVDTLDTSHSTVDVDSGIALALQPLLEQEALLESFVEEAQSQRKFEDVKTLKMNLAEIRREIERLLQGNGH